MSKFLTAASSRSNTPEDERIDFYLYVDELQRVSTGAFATILAEARKWRLNLTVANQYIAQLDEATQDALINSTGTIVSFRVGATDAKLMEETFADKRFEADEFVDLAPHEILVKYASGSDYTRPIRGRALPPLAQIEPGFYAGRKERLIRSSRKRYGGRRAVIEGKVKRFMGAGNG